MKSRTTRTKQRPLSLPLSHKLFCPNISLPEMAVPILYSKSADIAITIEPLQLDVRENM